LKQSSSIWKRFQLLKKSNSLMGKNLGKINEPRNEGPLLRKVYEKIVLLTSVIYRGITL
jgi:hypothetical protein